jgi:hypothetical protein
MPSVLAEQMSLSRFRTILTETGTCVLGSSLAVLEAEGDTKYRIISQRAFLLRSSLWEPQMNAEELFLPRPMGGARYADPSCLAVLAAGRLLAGQYPRVLPSRKGCLLGTTFGNALTVASFEIARTSGGRLSPLRFAHAGWNVPTALLSAELGCKGMVGTVSAGDRSGIVAVDMACRAVQFGRAAVMIVGAAGLDVLQGANTGRQPLRVLAASLLYAVARADGERTIDFEAFGHIPETATRLPPELTVLWNQSGPSDNA